MIGKSLFHLKLALGTLVLLILFAGIGFWGVGAASAGSAMVSSPRVRSSSTTPTPDFSATPVLPENPSQVDFGRFSYWFNCMPCHGDHGQGLTEAFRAAWVEDHQNCWERGCHGGKVGDEGFPIPTAVPAVIGSVDLLRRFPTAVDLYAYLSSLHPPQRPGALEEEEYWQLTAFLLSENGVLPTERDLGPLEGDSMSFEILSIVIGWGVLLILLVLAEKMGRLVVGSAWRRRVED
jgi:hypothetical protein